MFAKKSAIFLTIALLLTSVVAVPAFAARDIGEIAQGLADQTNYVGIFLVALAAVFGVGLLFWGGVQIYNATSHRGQGSVGRGLTGLVIGVVLCCIVIFAASGSKTIFGDESSMNDAIEGFE
jgi:hypothetical protein